MTDGLPVLADDGDDAIATDRSDDRDRAGGPDQSGDPDRSTDADASSDQERAADRVPTRDRLLDAVPDVDQATRPALAKLCQDQLDMLRSFLAGFDDREALLRWGQDAVIGTLGHVGDDWYTDVAMSRSDLATLITGDEREVWGDGDPPTLETAEVYRRAMAATDLIPACHAAARSMRWSATEYVDNSTDVHQPEPDVQSHPVMRPALSELAERQEWALDRLLGGFDSLDDLQAWIMAANQASYAELDSDLSRDLFHENHTREMLVVSPEDHRHGPFFRESFAAKYLLPAFNAAARELSERSGELAEHESNDLNVNTL